MDDQGDRKRYPLTHPQRRIWRTEQLFPGSPLHNLAGTVTYGCALDFERLKAAFNLLTSVHDALRIRLVDVAAAPHQYVADPEPLEPAFMDFSADPAPRAACARWVDCQARIPFVLEGEPLFRVAFFRVSRDACGYFINCHHIVADGWSIQAITRFISRAYRGEPVITAEAASYFDLVDEEKRHERSPRFRKDRQFWLAQLRGVPLYPADLHGVAGEQISIAMPGARSRWKRYAEGLGASLGNVITALLFVFLWKAEQSGDLVLGMPVLNRAGRQRDQIGMFTSTMPLRVQLRGDQSIADLIRQVQSATSRCFRHQRYPYDLLIRDLATASGSPGQLFRACVNVYSTHLAETARIGEETATFHECYVGQQLFPLYAVVKEWGADDTLVILLDYKPAVYPRQDVEQLGKLLGDALALTEAGDCTVEQLASHLSLTKVGTTRVVPGSECVISAGAEPPVYPRFPSTERARSQEREALDVRQVPFVLTDGLRAQLADLRRVLTAAVCVLLSRCADVRDVRIGVASARFTELACRIEGTGSFRDTLASVDAALRQGLEARVAGEDYGVIVDLTGRAERPTRSALLTLALSPTGPSGVIAYDSRVYVESEVEQIGARLLHLLTQVLASPDAHIADLDIVPPAERMLLLERFNDTRVAFPDQTTIVELFEATVAGCPDRIALRTAGETLTYAQLDRRAESFAAVLIQRGVSRGSIVPILLERSSELMVGVFGILKAGAAYLPIDPGYPRARIDYLLEDSNARLIVSRPGLFAGTPDRLLVEVDRGEHSTKPRGVASVAGPRDLAYVCYTSGSTGKPKGVMIEHRAIVNRLHWMQRAYPLTGRDVLLQKTSISFDVSVWELFWWTLAGASLCLCEQGDEKSPERLTEWIEQHGVTIVHFVPSMLQAFLKHVEEGGQAERLRSLRRCFASGEALRPEQVESFNRLLAGAGARLTNLYGPTEATVDVTYHDCAASGRCDRVPIGRPIDNIRLRVLNSALQLQPIGVPGELYLGGVGVARGYLNRAVLTAERFVSDPFDDAGRLYRTGDLARWLPNGEVEFLGRNDDQIKIRGYRIELGEIEGALLEHPCVENAVANVWRSPQGGARLCGYVVLRAPCTMQALQEYLAARLPTYMVPGVLTPIDVVPLGATGKANRAALPKPVGQETHQPPRTLEEAVLVDIWQTVLEVTAVGVEDNFFRLGGDSIKVISIVARAKAGGLSLTAEDVYRHPTIRQLALATAAVQPQHQAGGAGAFALLKPADRGSLPSSAEDAYPLSALQVGLLYQSRIIRATSFYHDVFSYRISGAFDGAKFAEAVSALCRNHPMLRTTFHLTGFSEPIQVVHRQVPVPLSVADLRGMSPEVRPQAVQRDIEAIRCESLAGDAARLIGFHVHLLSDSEYLYTIDFHDSALDGWSVNLLHRELFECYYALLEGRPSPLRRPASTFRDFVELERTVLGRSGHKEFWAKVLDGSHFLRVPRRPGHEAEGTGGVEFYQITMPQGLSDAVKDAAGQLGVPVKSVLLAAHVYVLSLLSGERDVVTGYEYGARPETPDSESVIGLFLNTVPLRVDAAGASWKGLVARLYQAEIDLMPHRHYPMAQMKWDRGVRGPLFETVFNFTHFHVLGGLKRLPGFDLLEVQVRAETEFVFRFECSIHPFSDELLLWVHYHQGVFPREQIETIGGYYVRALQTLVRDPSCLPSAAAVIGEQELKRQFLDFNDNAADTPRAACFPHLFEAQAAREPERIAATCGAERCTYEHLNQRANQLAHAILRQARRPECVVGVALPRNLAWMASVIGCFKAGAVYLPLDVEHPAQRIEQILRQSRCDLLMVEHAEPYTTLAQNVGAAILEVGRVFATETEWDNPGVSVSPASLAYIIFTSGSTGLPKGAMVEHGGMLNHLLAKVEDLGLRAQDVVAQNASQCFDISLWQLLAAALTGGRVALIGKEENTDLRRFVARVREEGVSILEVVPSYLATLLEGLAAMPPELDSLRYLLVTGEQVSMNLIKAWFDVYPRIPVVNAYGPTEASDDICHHIMTGPPTCAVVPVGKPVRNMRIHVLDAHLAPVPIGSFGEICVSGVGVGRGYVNDPERTRAVFVPDPFDASRRMYRTGDLGRWSPHGVVELSGRRDEQIKIRGYRIETGEIEHHLKNCPGIGQGAVVADAAGATLVAFVVTDSPIDPGPLRRELSLHLPEYMVPSRFIRVGQLPLTEHGKVSKQSLLRELQSAQDERALIAEPLGPAEVELSRAWSALLGVDTARIGRFSDFFELGGDSLKAMQLSLRMGERISINDVVKYPHLKDLAERLLTVTMEPREVLVEFGSTVAPTLSIVGFSYAAGSAANFKPFFDEISARRGDVACFAIEMPRLEVAPAEPDLEAIVRVCVERIRVKVHTPLLLWGHCSGSAPALAAARRLEREGVDVRMIVIGGKVITSPPVSYMRRLASRALSPFMAVDAASMTWEQIKEWLVRKTAFDGFAGLGDDEARRVADTFRHDAILAARFFESAWHNRDALRVSARLLNLVAEDDLLTRGYRRKYGNWRLFSDHVQLEVLPDGGHYFVKTRPRIVTELILQSLHRLETRAVETSEASLSAPSFDIS